MDNHLFGNIVIPRQAQVVAGLGRALVRARRPATADGEQRQRARLLGDPVKALTAMEKAEAKRERRRQRNLRNAAPRERSLSAWRWLKTAP